MSAALAFLSAHYVAILSAWIVTHTIAQTVHAKCPPTTWYGKAAAVWSAINPLDVVKALNSLGAQFSVPVAVAALAIVIPVGALALGGCHPPTPPETPALDVARANEKAAATAFVACAATTGIADKMKGDQPATIAVDELQTCILDLASLGVASVRLHEAEQTALAALDGGPPPIDAGGP